MVYFAEGIIHLHVCVYRWIYTYPWWHRRWSVCLQCGRPGFDPWVGKIPWRRKWQSTPGLLPGKSHGQRSLVGYSPRGCKESDTTERLHYIVICICRCTYKFMFGQRFRKSFRDIFIGVLFLMLLSCDFFTRQWWPSQALARPTSLLPWIAFLLSSC